MREICDKCIIPQQHRFTVTRTVGNQCLIRSIVTYAFLTYIPKAQQGYDIVLIVMCFDFCIIKKEESTEGCGKFQYDLLRKHESEMAGV